MAMGKANDPLVSSPRYVTRSSNEGSKQAFAPEAGVMHELKEAQVKRQFLLGVTSRARG